MRKVRRAWLRRIPGYGEQERPVFRPRPGEGVPDPEGKPGEGEPPEGEASFPETTDGARPRWQARGPQQLIQSYMALTVGTDTLSRSRFVTMRQADSVR